MKPPVKNHFKRLSRLQTIVIVGCSVLFIAGWFVFQQLMSPVHGRIVPSHGKVVPMHKASAKPAVAQTLQNSYYRLDLPAGYVAQPAQSPPAGLLYTQTIIKQSSLGSLIIAIGVQTLPEGGLGDDSSYKLRQQNPSRYHLSSQTVQGETLQLANDAEQASVVAFWVHGGLLATISVSSGVGNPAQNDNSDVVRALTPLLAAWKWQ